MKKQYIFRLWLACLVTTLFFAPFSIAQDLREVPQSEAQAQLSYAPVVKKAAPAVVNVFSKRTIRTSGSSFGGSSMFERMFGRGIFGPQERVQQSLGSGVIVGEGGVIVTNNHVVQGADELRVVLADRREFDATLLLSDEKTDLAVLRIELDGETLPIMPFATQNEAEVGDLVLAIGNPFGVGQTVTSGIVSALARTDVGSGDYSFFIQTDASINPGNSGGALVSMDGELLGVNTVILSRSGGSNGIGFAIPAAMVRRVVEAAVSDGEVVRPWFGARLQNVDRDLSASLGLDRPRGALVSQIYPKGSAARAGIKRGDVVLAVGGQDINSEQGLRFRLAIHKVGEQVPVKILRDGAELVKQLTTRAAPEIPLRNNKSFSGTHPFGGAEIANLSPALAEEKGLDPFAHGVLVLHVQSRSAAGYYGFRPGDIVRELNDVIIEDVADLVRAIEVGEGWNRWPVRLERGGKEVAGTIRIRN
ncbi:MAG: Do family serine endopeptidase [Robiginitomaculum sp.]|nr:Do family serine endopeptidase [Robiginitomaculum sp.]